MVVKGMMSAYILPVVVSVANFLQRPNHLERHAIDQDRGSANCWPARK